MALQSLPGSPFVLIGHGTMSPPTGPGTTNVTIDAVNEACIFLGHMMTSDGGSHTIDTSGSSSIQWRSGSVTFANGSTTFKVGIAPVDTATGPAGRASNTTDVINFDVNASFTGGGGGVTANAWQTSVPTTGTKTIANGDLVAVCMQMTARGGADVVNVTYTSTNTAHQLPYVTAFTGGSYAAQAGNPNFIVQFSDGAYGFFIASDVLTSLSSTTFNSSSGQKEYGQLFNLPFPMKVYGAYGFINISGNFDVVLYSDPLGTPAAEKTVSIDSNYVASSGATRRFYFPFASPYTTKANQNIVLAFKPGASNVNASFKTLNAAAHRIADPWGTSGYGVSRSTGAFADTNSGLNHYYIGLIVGAFEHPVQPTYIMGF